MVLIGLNQSSPIISWLKKIISSSRLFYRWRLDFDIVGGLAANFPFTKVILNLVQFLVYTKTNMLITILCTITGEQIGLNNKLKWK